MSTDDVAVILPVIDPIMAGECLATMSTTVRNRVTIIDNCYSPLRPKFDVHGIFRPARNLGVARSWNMGMILNVAASVYVFISAQVRFGEHRGLDMLEVAAAAETVTSPAPTHWHTIMFPAWVFERVGRFDENFYPAYYEDIDMLRRCLIAGIEFDDAPKIDAAGSRDGHGVDQLRGQHPGYHTINYDELQRYWERKWGVTIWDAADLKQGNTTPFGRKLPLDWWPQQTIDNIADRHGIRI